MASLAIYPYIGPHECHRKLPAGPVKYWYASAADFGKDSYLLAK